MRCLCKGLLREIVIKGPFWWPFLSSSFTGTFVTAVTIVFSEQKINK